MVLDYMLRLMTQVVDGLTVDRQRMHRNLLQGGGIVFSQRVLLALVEHGMDRDQAYRIVQRAAHRALDDGQQFREVIAQAPEVRERLTPDELSTLFDPAYYLRNLRVTYERVGLA
jgi:adenylosuccinate lyase